MDQQRSEDIVSDTTEKVGNTVGDLGAKAGKIVQDKVDQSKSVLRDVQESVAAAVDKTADLARKVSGPAVQAADAIQGIARDVGNQVGQAAGTVGGEIDVFPGAGPDRIQVMESPVGKRGYRMGRDIYDLDAELRSLNILKDDALAVR